MLLSDEYSGKRKQQWKNNQALQFICTVSLFFLLVFSIEIPRAFAQGSSVPVFSGYRDFGYGTIPTGEITAEKPESKLWYNDGYWWANMWATNSSRFRIYRFDKANQTWVEVGPDVDTRSKSSQDVLWDGTKLYIASHARISQTSAPFEARLYRYSYNASTDTYTLDSGFPVQINSEKSRSLVIEKDSTGKLWAVWTSNVVPRRVMINHTTTDDLTWSTPFELPNQGNDLGAETNGNTADIASIIAVGSNKIGVLWSNHVDEKFYFIVHLDGNSETTWQSREVAYENAVVQNAADDHLNLTCGSNGTVVAVVKSTANGTEPLVNVLKRNSSTSVWTSHLFGIASEEHTRPIALIDSDTDSVYVFARSDDPAVPKIYYKVAHVDNLTFPSGLGRLFLASDLDTDINDPTSTKQCVNASTGLVVLASDEGSDRYFHNFLALGGNARPVAVNDNVTAPIAIATNLNVLANDTDANGNGTIDPTTVAIVQNPANGTVSVNSTTGIVTYTGNAAFTGTDTFQYTMKDNEGESAVAATVTVTVSANQPPVANDDAATTNEDAAVNINVLANDTDPVGTIDPTTVVVVSAPANGTTSVNSTTGVVTYTPNANFFGINTFTYNVKDNNGATSNTATVTVTVTDVNDPPVAVNDAATTPEDNSVVINVLSNDSDVDGTLVPSTVSASGPGHGSVSVNPTTGAITFFPAANFFGTDTFNYTVKDDDGATSNTATVTVTITAVNDPPVAVNDNAATNEDTPVPIDVLANDSDVDGTLVASTVTVTGSPANGTISLNTSTGVITYTPNLNFTGTDSFTYTVKDNNNATSNAATVTVDVAGSNDPPVAVNDNATTPEDNAVVIPVLSNDFDVDGTLNPATVTVVTPPANGTTSVNPSTGAVTYTPNLNFNGTNTFTYTVKDNLGATSNVATVTVTVTNNPPTAVDDVATTNEDTAVDINVLANDFDSDGTLNASTVAATAPSNGSTTVQPTGVVTYTPNPNFFGTDSFTYTVKDNTGLTSNVATVTITVNSVNDPPVAANDAGQTNEAQAVTIDVLANDSDIDGTLDPATVTVGSAAANGSTSVNTTTGAITYTPNAGFSGTDTFTYRVKDNGGANSNFATVTITVNDSPVAANDNALTIEDNPVVIDVLANDTDSDGTIDPTTVTIVSGPANGTTSVNLTTGQVTYTPNANFFGTNTFTYKVKDNQNAFSNVATVTVIVNREPIAVNDSKTTNEDVATNIDVTANDIDQDGTINPTTVTIVSGTTNGTTSVNPTTGVVTYTSNAEFSGGDSFTYTVKDNYGATSNMATVSITINNVNDPPVAVNDNAAAGDLAITIDVKANDSDVDGTLDPTTVTIVTGPSNGTATVNPTTGVVSYDPDLGFTGIDTFTYTIKDNLGATSNIATVTINVNSTNAPPVANDDAATTNEDTPISINVLANDSDSDGSIDPTTVTIVSNVTNGTTSVNASTGVVTYTPAANYFGSDSFTYTVKDNLGFTSNVATVTITVNSVNDPPVANDDAALTNEGFFVNINVTANDTDIDGTINNNSVAATAASNGTTTVLAGGVVRYTPNAGFVGTDTFIYTVKDNQNAFSNEATVTVTVNDFPVAVDDAALTNKNIAVSINVLANDSDSDGTLDPATVTVVSNPANGTTSVNTTTGAITYTPNSNFVGTNTFTYTVKDNNGATSNAATVTVTVNDFPVAVNDVAFTNKGNAVTINVLANDTDPDGTLDPTTVTVGTGPSNGTTSVNPATGAVTYTPNASFFGNDTFTYTVKDNRGAISNAATVTVEVNSPPIAVNDGAITNEDVSVNINVLGNDLDPDGTLNVATVTIISNVVNGTTSVNSSTGVITYTPNVNFFGTDGFTYTVNDNDGATSNVVTVNITVTEVNDPPVALNDGALTAEETPVEINVTANDSDVDGTINPTTVTVATLPGNGTTSVNPTTGAITYTPNLNFEGIDSFTYTVKDDDGASSNAATVTVDVGGSNDPPVAVDDAATVNEEVATPINVLSNDSDVDGTIDPTTVTIVTPPVNGTAVVNPVTGVVTYTSNVNYVGSDSFTYTVKDNLGALSNVATVTVTINDVNDPPVAVNDGASTAEETPVDVDVTANDSDLDGTLNLSTVTVATPPGNGATSVNPTTGVITYTPNLNFEGTDTFTYTVKDDDGASSNAATVTVDVGGSNDPPVAVSDVATVDEEVATPINVLSNDSDVDGTIDPTTVTIVTPPSNGTAVVNPTTGVVTYTSNVNFVGGDSFTYTVKDNLGALSNVATVAVTVNDVNDPPVAVNDGASTAEETPVAINVTANDSDVDGTINPTTVTVATLPANGTTAVNPTTGVITYTPNLNFEGIDSFTYTVKDDDGASSNAATVTVDVGGQNDPPLAVNDNITTDEDVITPIAVLSNDTDIDGTINVTTVTIITSPINGTANVNTTTGVVTYTPDAEFFGADSFTYTVEDNLGLTSNVATVNITINEVNDPPVAQNDSAATEENISVQIDVLANDTDIDRVIDPTTVAVVTVPLNGTTSVHPTTGVITYTPNTNFGGTDAFTYRVSDTGGAVSNEAAVTVRVSDVIIPIEDAYVRSSDPTLNFGSGTELRARKSTSGILQVTYLKFNVSGLTGPVTSAKIRLFSLDNTDEGGSIFAVSNNYAGTSTPWDEDGLIYNNRPAVSGSPLFSLGSITANSNVEWDVTSAITGNGIYSFAITSNSDLAARYDSKEAANDPKLIIDFVGASPLAPLISSFTPTSGIIGTEVTISGDHFNGTAAVKFNGTSAASFTVVSNTQVRATVPTGATTGKINVTNTEGTGISSADFTVILPSSLSSFIPANGPVSTEVTISGSNFIGTTSVDFNGVSASAFIVDSNSQVRAIVPAGATTGPINVTNPAGSAATATNFTVILAPLITSFTPTTGAVGTQVTITGNNFTGTTSVAINGTAATNLLVDSNTQVRATVGAGSTTGKVSVTNAAGTATSTNDFVVQLPPAITSFTPAGGPVGTQVTIAGSNFATATLVKFNGVLAGSFTINSDAEIFATVPSGATTGPISITNNVGTGSSSTNFIVTDIPTVSSFTPSSGTVGTEVTITGSTFTGATGVAFNGTPASVFTVDSNTQIRATVPNGATTGKISVTNAAGTGESVANFIVLSGPSTLTLNPIHDSYVWESSSNSNFGTGTELRARTSSGGVRQHTYLKFNVTGLAGAASSAKIRLFVMENGNQGGSMHSVSNNLQGSATAWTESNITFSNAPAIGGSALSSIGPITGGTTVEFDVTPAITGNGIFSFAIQSTSSDAAKYHSKENTNDPELVIATGGGSANQPVVSSFTPQTGVVGTEVTISGSNFTGATNLSFSGITAAVFFSDSDSQMRAVVAAGTTTGKISVTNPNGTGLSANDFTIVNAPTITSFTPTSGPVGTQVTISGSNFTGTTGVTFNGVAASAFTIISSTTLHATVPNGATTGLINVQNAAGSANSASNFTVILSPSITSFTPSSGPISTQVTIAGTNFTSVSAVAFNGTVSTFTVDSAIQIRANVPNGATTGKITVTNPAGTGTSATDFTIILSPVVSAFIPASGIVGSNVTVTGSNFNGITNVAFNGIAATFTVDSATQLRATVPSGATTGLITVTNPAGSGSSSTNFTVIQPPSITSFTPTSGIVGAQVTITGSNFTGTTTISFNGAAASVFTVDSNTQIRVTVPNGATTGPVSVQNPAGSATTVSNFTVILAPTVSSFTPTSGPVGTSITISGSNFTNVASVTFNGTSALGFIVDSATQIRANVPAGATSGKIGVTNPAGTATSATDFTVEQPPVITSFSPSGGLAGTLVTILGNHFTTASGVAFNGISASSFTIESNSEIRATVPVGASTGPVSVTNPIGTGISSTNFIVTGVPSITSFTPSSGSAGTEVTISGNTFTGATAVAFNGTPASGFTVVSNTQVRATVPGGATTGKISVANVAGSGESVANFIVLSGPSSLTFNPIHDAYVWSANATTNYGTATELRARTSASATQYAFLKFNVTGVVGTITSAKIRLFVLENGNQGGSIHSVSNNLLSSATAWTESNIISNNAPTVGGSALSSVGAITAGTIVEFNVTAAISGNGIFSFGIKSTSSDAAKYHSKENSNDPQLVIEIGGGAANLPAITAFNPAAGVTGSEVTITGSNFTGATNVSFNGISAAAFIVDNNAQLRAVVAAGTTTGKISVTNANGTGLSANDFTIVSAPTVTSFIPTSGPVGTEVTVSGSNFTGATGVTFNGTPASSFTVLSNSQLKATVANGATSGVINVQNAAGNANSSSSFTVIQPPTVTSFTPTSGPIGTQVTISGTNFVSVSGVTFNNTAATFTVDSDTQIRATVPVGTTNGIIKVTNAAGIASSASSFTVIQSPAITTFTPNAGIVGTSVTVSGSNFTGTTGVLFNGTPASTFTVDSNTQFRVTVPSGATTGFITATNPAGSGASSTNFTVIQPPSITSFTPTSGIIGSSVTITGNNFTGTTTVSFNGTAASIFTVDSNTQIRATVPSGATTGPVSVQNPAGSATSASNFTVILAPTISSFTPTSGPVGTSVTISGNNFSSVSGVSFNGTAAAVFAVDSPSQIRATVPSGATTGTISVTNPAGTGTSSGTFTVLGPPVITSFTPGSGLVGIEVTIAGSNFSGSTAVAFNGTPAAGFITDSGIQIRAVVPNGATSGPISVTNAIGTGTSSTNFTVILPPTISSFTPTSGTTGTQVTITGNNFSGISGVTFNGTSASSFAFDSNTQVRATVPSGATTGPIAVSNLAGTGTSANNFTIAAGATTLIFNPTDDAYVRSANPENEYGSTVDLRVRKATGGELTNSFLKFNVTGITSTILSAKIQLFSTESSNQGGSMFSVSNNLLGTGTPWTEAVINYNNAPAISGSPLSSAGQVNLNQTVEFNVTAAIVGNGIYSFGFNSTSNDAAVYGSSESANSPKLVIEMSGGGSPTPPTISSFTPTSGVIGTAVTILGNNFTGATAVSFNATSAGGFVVDSNLQIRVNVPNGATTGPISVTTAGGTATSVNAFVVLLPPTISSFTPTSGPVGTEVTITGSHFSGLTGVTFNGTSSISPTLDSDIQIRAQVPSGATTGPIIVSNAAGNVASVNNFTVTQVPVVSSFTPTSALVGSQVTVTGLNFTGASAVKFNNVSATFSIDSATQIRASVPAGATTGKVSVTTAAGTGTSASDFTVILPPTISSFTPTSGAVGTQVTITGTNFVGITNIAFNGVSATSFIFDSSTQMRANVPSGATTGPISVTNAAGTATSASNFTVGSGSGTFTFLPTGDSYVRSSRTTETNGNDSVLKVRTTASAIRDAYLKFNVTGLSGTVQSAKVRLKVEDGSIDGGGIYSVSNNFLGTGTPWTEAVLNWDNAPGISGSPLSSLGVVNTGATIEFDVTAAIIGDGVYSFAIHNQNDDVVDYSSKDGSQDPELVITTGSGLPKESPELADGSDDEEIEANEPELPEKIALYPNYPNPFNAETNIEYALPENAKVKLGIFNLRGQLVKVLVNDEQKAGVKKVRWDGKNGDGNDVGSGVYFLRLEIGEQKLSRKITLQK